jgi:hypothetical protein
MQYFTIIAALFAGAAFAAPVQDLEDRQLPYVPCSGLYASAQCCATDVLGVADLDCGQREFSNSRWRSLDGIYPSLGNRH